ncbi:MAG: metallophosphoesterase [Candidatus Korarchaeota archaeon]|nr:metallophosphoesterase [Thermoproteota archaeon]
MEELFKKVKERFQLLPEGMLHIKDLQSLVFADTHIGLEFALAEKGLFIPPVQYSRMKLNILRAIKHAKPERIIILGDLKHKFEERTPQEHKEVLDLLASLKSLNKELILIRGNHDTYISGFLERFGVKVLDYLILEDIVLIHGHKPVPEDIVTEDKFLVMAHVHPVVTVFDGISHHRFKCFLLGERSLILPALTPLLSGFDIINGMMDSDEYKSPLLEDNLNDYEVILVSTAGHVLNFGKVIQLQDRLKRGIIVNH